MSAVEFATYRDFITNDRGRDCDARQETDRMLPEGPATKGHYLLSINSTSGNHVGVVWMTSIDRSTGREAFILDLVIFPEFRRHGFARAVIPLLEQFAEQLALPQISLSVSSENSAALSLYEATGFRPVFTRMTKTLKRPNAPPTPGTVTPRATEGLSKCND